MQQSRSAGARGARALTHYDRLQVSPQAAPEVIRAAYRALAALHHPDRAAPGAQPGPPGPVRLRKGECGGAAPLCGPTAPQTASEAATQSAAQSATQRMAEINAAYAVLSDPHRRRAYDAELAAVAGAAPSVWRASGGTGRRGLRAAARRLRPWRAAMRRWARQAPARQAALACAAGLVLLAGVSAWALRTVWRTEQAVVLAWQQARGADAGRPATSAAWAAGEATGQAPDRHAMGSIDEAVDGTLATDAVAAPGRPVAASWLAGADEAPPTQGDARARPAVLWVEGGAQVGAHAPRRHAVPPQSAAAVARAQRGAAEAGDFREGGESLSVGAPLRLRTASTLSAAD